MSVGTAATSRHIAETERISLAAGTVISNDIIHATGALRHLGAGALNYITAAALG